MLLLGKIIGEVIPNKVSENLNREKFYLLQPVDEKYNSKGSPLVAVDRINATYMDIVIWVSSREAAYAMDDPFSSVDAAIIGKVDSIVD